MAQSVKVGQPLTATLADLPKEQRTRTLQGAVGKGGDCWRISPNPEAFYINEDIVVLICCSDPSHTIIVLVEFNDANGRATRDDILMHTLLDSDPCVSVRFTPPDTAVEACFYIACVKKGVACSNWYCYPVVFRPLPVP